MRISVNKKLLLSLTKKGYTILKNKSDLIITGVVCLAAGSAITSPIVYSKGIRAGYVEVSEIYEKKFRKQTELFLKKIKSVEKHKEEYEALIHGYKDLIYSLEEQLHNTEEELNLLKILRNDRENLLNLNTSIT